jgi:penicillin-binding protein 2
MNIDSRFRIFSLFFGIALLIIFGRLVFLSGFMGSYYRSLAFDNKMTKKEVPAQRGRILDRNGKVLAESINEDGKFVRFYPFGEMVAHVVGYVNSDNEGVIGVENYYDEELSGVSGENLLETEALGTTTKEFARKEALAGKDVKTNIDFELQKNIYLILKEELDNLDLFEGVVIVSKINGEILSLVSLPSFDINLFTGTTKRGEAGGDYADIKQVLTDETSKPLFDRAISGAYAPGSVYKLVPAIAGLSERIIDGRYLVKDEGEIKVGEERFGNWYFDQYGRVEGDVDIVRALARSNDIFFYKLGEEMGEDKLILWSRKLGLGSKTGIDLAGEVSGLVPDPLWRERTLGSRWYLGNTYHMSIGQGDLMATPMQINRMTAGVVSGKLCSPRVRGGESDSCQDLEINDVDRKLILEGMRRACSRGESYDGTAFVFFDLEEIVYCKTGTAQQGGEKSNPHAWMSVVIPDEDSDIVMTVMLPAGGEGSKVAGPIARKVVDYILKNEF